MTDPEGPQDEPQCPHGQNCGCAIGTRHFWYVAFCEERDSALRSASRTTTTPTPQGDDLSRCAICGWSLAASTMQGCMPGNCSQRPSPSHFYAPARAKAEYAPYLDADPRCVPHLNAPDSSLIQALTDYQIEARSGHYTSSRQQVMDLIQRTIEALSPKEQP